MGQSRDVHSTFDSNDFWQRWHSDHNAWKVFCRSVKTSSLVRTISVALVSWHCPQRTSLVPDGSATRHDIHSFFTVANRARPPVVDMLTLISCVWVPEKRDSGLGMTASKILRATAVGVLPNDGVLHAVEVVSRVDGQVVLQYIKRVLSPVVLRLSLGARDDDVVNTVADTRCSSRVS